MNSTLVTFHINCKHYRICHSVLRLTSRIQNYKCSECSHASAGWLQDPKTVTAQNVVMPAQAGIQDPKPQ